MKRLVITKNVNTYHSTIHKPNWADPSWLEFDRTAPALGLQVTAIILSNKTVVRDDFFTSPYASQRGYAGLILDDGSISPNAGSLVLDLHKVKSNNRDRWKTRAVTKEMIVASYAVRKCKFDFTYGASQIPEEDFGSYQVHGADIADILPWPTSTKYPGYLDIGGGEFLSTVTTIEYEVAMVDVHVHPFDMGVQAESLRTSFHEPISAPVDPSWVQSEIADANTKALDWLTTFAEAPKTVATIISAIRTIRDVLRSWDKRGEAIRENHKKWVADLRKRISETLDLISKAKATTLKRKLYRTLRKLNNRLSREGKILIDKLTGAWMMYRYEIMPLVYTVQDAVKAANTYKNQYFTCRGRVITPHSPPDIGPTWVFTGESSITTKLMIKFGYYDDPNSTADLLNRVLYGNILTTGWELITRSFVADWFITVGDWLTASFGFTESESVKRVSTMSHKCVIKGYYVEEFTGAKVIIDFESYERFLPDLSSYSGIYFRPNLTAKRMVDAFCLTWPSLKRTLTSR